jgi:hypothetical protein
MDPSAGRFALVKNRFAPRVADIELKSPTIFSSHRTTSITTRPFKIDLIDPAMGR